MATPLDADPFDSTELAAMIPEVWTPIVQEEMFAKTVAANFFTDLSPYAQNGGDIFHIPNVYTNAFTPNTQATQGTEVTTEAPAQTDVTLTVDTHKYIATLIGDKDKQQLSGNYDYNAVYARKIGSTLADALEDSIFALWSGLTTNTVGDTATVLSDSEVRQSINSLEALNFNTMQDTAWFLHPYVFYIQLAAVQKYYDASQAGGTGSFVREGNFGPMDASRGLRGHLYGIPIYLSTNVVSGLQTYRNLLARKEALGFAVQTPGGSKVRVQAENDISRLGIVTVADIIYGVAELRDQAAVVVNASSAFIGS